MSNPVKINFKIIRGSFTYFGSGIIIESNGNGVLVKVDGSAEKTIVISPDNII